MWQQKGGDYADTATSKNAHDAYPDGHVWDRVFGPDRHVWLYYVQALLGAKSDLDCHTRRSPFDSATHSGTC